ncbi:MAG: hypothetical protein ABIH70_01480 [Chloroflexota bacterium]
MLVGKISDVGELFPALHHIAENKNNLSMQVRGWVNILGLYVQSDLVFVGDEMQVYLAAGGKFRKYFYAVCHYALDGDKDAEIMASTMMWDFSHWKVKKFNEEVWEKRFAHLVLPTCEIAWCLATEKNYSPRKFMDVVNHFKSTGEWLGLYDNKCPSCGQNILWWDYFCCKPCPHCGQKIRE